MVRMGLEKSMKRYHVLEKSLKVETLWDILEKKKPLLKKSVLCKGKIESTAVRKFSWWS